MKYIISLRQVDYLNIKFVVFGSRLINGAGTQLHVSLSLSITNEMNIYCISMLVGFM